MKFIRPIKITTIILIIICMMLLICNGVFIKEEHTESVVEETSGNISSEFIATSVMDEPIVTSTESKIEKPIEPKIISEPLKYNINSDDIYILAKIIMAEAEGEDIEGKAYVAMVVLNRVNSNEFPDTIHDVVFQKGQFSPTSNGRYDRVEPDEECWQTIEMVMNGWDKSQGALYFESHSNTDNWHSKNLKYLFTHGCHRFYK